MEISLSLLKRMNVRTNFGTYHKHWYGYISELKWFVIINVTVSNELLTDFKYRIYVLHMHLQGKQCGYY